ncbi:MAG: hypothetical protein ABSF23_06760, partial [Terracidiphilus sp.]
PVDPTQMVSQMVSLNQLDQLIAINEKLASLDSSSSSTSTSGSKSGSAQAQSTPSTASLSPASTTAGAYSPVAAARAAAYQIPAAQTGTGSNAGLMNLYGNFGQAGTTPYLTNEGVR